MCSSDLAILTYAFSKLHPNQRQSIMELMHGLILGWEKQSVYELAEDANARFLEAAEQLRATLAARNKQD